MSRKMDIVEPFEPLEPKNSPAYSKVVSKNIVDLVNQYYTVNSEVKRLNRRKAILRPQIAKILRTEGDKNDKGDIIAQVDGKQVKVSPRHRYIVDKDMAIRVLGEKELLDKVATKVLCYEIKPSFAGKLARRIYQLLEKLGIANKVNIYTEWLFDEETIDNLYHSGDLDDDDIDSICTVEPIGEGYALYIEGMEEID